MDERYQNNIYEISFYVTEEMHLNDWLFVTFSSKIFLRFAAIRLTVTFHRIDHSFISLPGGFKKANTR